MHPNATMTRLLERLALLGVHDSDVVARGLPEARIQALRGGALPTAAEFELLCRAAAVDPAAMARNDDVLPTRVPARFRAAAAVGDRPSEADARILALAAELGRILGHLRRLQGRDLPLASLRQVRAVARTTEVWREGYNCGEAARQAIRPAPGPIAELENLVHDQGIHVARVRFSSPAVDAACVWEAGAAPVILLNLGSPQVRYSLARRAILAHEVCHLLHDAGDREDVTTRMSWGVDRVGNYRENIEVRARGFAPAFLAPRDQVRVWEATLPHRVQHDDVALVKALAEHWGLSFEGAAWHAKNANLLSPDRAENLARMHSKPRRAAEAFERAPVFRPPAHLRQELPESPAPMWAGLATRIVVESVEAGAISAARARELLTWH